MRWLRSASMYFFSSMLTPQVPLNLPYLGSLRTTMELPESKPLSFIIKSTKAPAGRSDSHSPAARQSRRILRKMISLHNKATLPGPCQSRPVAAHSSILNSRRAVRSRAHKDNPPMRCAKACAPDGSDQRASPFISAAFLHIPLFFFFSVGFRFSS